jgi:hypothetical protein
MDAHMRRDDRAYTQQQQRQQQQQPPSEVEAAHAADGNQAADGGHGVDDEGGDCETGRLLGGGGGGASGGSGASDGSGGHRSDSLSPGINPGGIVEAEDILEAIGVGLFQWKIMALAALGWMSCAMAVNMVSFLLPVLGPQWRMTGVEKGFLGGSGAAGMLAGVFLWSPACDTIGRRWALLMSMSILVLFQALTGLTSSYHSFLACQMMLGFGKGGVMPSTLALATEYLPPSERGVRLSCFLSPVCLFFFSSFSLLFFLIFFHLSLLITP